MGRLQALLRTQRQERSGEAGNMMLAVGRTTSVVSVSMGCNAGGTVRVDSGHDTPKPDFLPNTVRADPSSGGTELRPPDL